MPGDSQELPLEPDKQSGASLDRGTNQSTGSGADTPRLLEEFFKEGLGSRSSADYFGKSWELLELAEKRNALESKLPPEKKKLLQEYRVAMSCADQQNERDKYKNLIDKLDPSLAKINRQLSEAPDLAPALQSLSLSQMLESSPMLSTIAARKEHSQLVRLPITDSKIVHQLPEYQNNWYAPYRSQYLENKALAERYRLGFELRHENGKAIPKFYVLRGEKKEYLAASDKEALEQEINERVEAKLQELEQNPHVRFSRFGEDVMKQFYKDASGNYLEGKQILKAQQWSLNDLYAIEEALRISEGSLDGFTINVSYLSEPTDNTGNLHAGEYWSANEIYGPRIILFSNQPSYEESLDKLLGLESLRITTVVDHEIVHHEQRENDFWNQTDLIEQMGWHKYREGIGKGVWLLKAKDNKYFMFLDESKQWLLCNEKGQAIDEQFNLVSAGAKIQLFSSKDVRERALFRPVDDYFKDAGEMHAQAVAYYRSSIATRITLLRNNEKLCKIAEDWDQKIIDRHQREVDKQSLPGTIIRLPDGSLEKANKENSSLVRIFKVANSGFFAFPADRLNESSDNLTKVQKMTKDNQFHTAQPQLEVTARYDLLLKDIAFLDADSSALELQIENLQKMKDSKQTRELVADRTRLLKNYHDLRAQTYAQCAAFELTNGDKKKAEKYLRLAKEGGEVKEIVLEGDKVGDAQLAMFLPFKSIKRLSINRTKITDAGFNTISQFANLEELNIWDNKQATDAGLSKLVGLNSLKTLTLGHMPEISNAGLAHFASAQSLSELKLVDVPIGVNGIKQVMRNLDTLELRKIKLGDDGVEALSKAPALRKLELHDTNITDSALLHIKKFPNLMHLVVLDPISDQGLRNLHGAEIYDLSVFSDKIKGDALTELAKLPELGVLNLQHTKIMAESLEALTKIPKLNYAVVGTSIPISKDVQKKVRGEVRKIVPYFTLILDEPKKS